MNRATTPILAACLALNMTSGIAGSWWGDEQELSNIPYNYAIHFSVHNTYDKHDVYGVNDDSGFKSFLDSQIASVELDFYAEGDNTFSVGHNTWNLDDESICQESGNRSPLANCLSDIKSWITVNQPDYPITLFVDLKNSGDYNQTTYQNLEQVFYTQLGSQVLFSPSDLAAGYGTPRQRIEASGWPTLYDMRGKVIVFIATGNDELRRYAAGTYHNGPGDTAFFVTPNPCESGVGNINDSRCDLRRYSDWVVSLNQKHQWSSAKAMGSRAFAHGMVLRNWDTDDSCNSTGEDFSYNDFQSALNEFLVTHYGADPRRGNRSNNYPKTCGVPYRNGVVNPNQDVEKAFGTRSVEAFTSDLEGLTSGYFKIRNVEQNLCINEANVADEGQITFRNCNDNDTRIRIVKASGGRHWQAGDGTLMMEVEFQDDNNASLNIEKETFEAGKAAEWESSVKSNGETRWYLARLPDGYYRIFNKYNGLCMRAHYDDYVKVDACNGHVSSEWSITRY